MCDRHYGIHGYPICSGNGYCVLEKCICNSGWTSNADFQSKEGYDCDININAMKVLCGLVVGLGFIPFFFTIQYLLVTYPFKPSNSLEFNLQPHYAIGICHVIMILFSIIYGCCKIIDPTIYYIGNSNSISKLMTISVAISSFLLSTTSAIFIIICCDNITLFSRMLDGEIRKKLQQKVNKTKKILIPTFGFLAISVLITILLIGIIFPSHADVILIFFILTIISVSIAITIFIFYIFNIHLNEVRRYIQSHSQTSMNSLVPIEIVQGYNKLNKLKQSFIPNLVFSILPNFAFAFFPFLRRKFTYQFLVITISVTPILMVILELIKKNDSIESFFSFKENNKPQKYRRNYLHFYSNNHTNMKENHAKIIPHSILVIREQNLQMKNEEMNDLKQINAINSLKSMKSKSLLQIEDIKSNDLIQLNSLYNGIGNDNGTSMIVQASTS